MRYRLRTLMIWVTAMGAVCGGIAFVLRHVPVVHRHVVNATFSELPKNERELTNWLDRQPGVSLAVVGQHGSTIRIAWEMDQPLMGGMKSPSVQQELPRFGYKGVLSYEETSSIFWPRLNPLTQRNF